MQDSWPQLTSDSMSGRETLKNPYNSQIKCPVGSTLCLPKDENWSEPKGWIQGNTKIATSYLQGKYGVEIRLQSANRDNSHTWVRIYHDLNKLVANWNDDEQEISEMQFEDFALNRMHVLLRADLRPKQNHKDVLLPVYPQEVYFFAGRTWTDIEPQEYLLTEHSVSKKLINLLRHGSLPREDDGPIEFWRTKDYLSNQYVHSSRSLRTQSNWSFITTQCENFGRFLRVHLQRRMCNQFTFHQQIRIDIGQAKFEQQTDSILPVCEFYGQRTERS